MLVKRERHLIQNASASLSRRVSGPDLAASIRVYKAFVFELLWDREPRRTRHVRAGGGGGQWGAGGERGRKEMGARSGHDRAVILYPSLCLEIPLFLSPNKEMRCEIM